MRVICTSGSVRDGDGNVPIYSAVDLGRCVETGGKGGGIGHGRKRAEEVELALGEGGAHLLEEQGAEAAGQHANRQEEARLAGDPTRLVGRDPAAGDDAVKMRVVVQRLSPGMQHRDRADLGAEIYPDSLRIRVRPSCQVGPSWTLPAR